jgi:hypothetical protein
MKKTFQQLSVNFPQAMSEFAFWLVNQYKIREKEFDESISIHRYIIMARFIGENTEPPRFANDQLLETYIEDMLSRYESAINIVTKTDPLMDLTNLDWKTRNEMTEKTFTRQTNPSIRDTLVMLTNFRLPGLSDTLIPYKGRSLEFGRMVSLGEPDTDQFWIDNIKWAWDVNAGKIEIPF